MLYNLEWRSSFAIDDGGRLVLCCCICVRPPPLPPVRCAIRYDPSPAEDYGPSPISCTSTSVGGSVRGAETSCRSQHILWSVDSYLPIYLFIFGANLHYMQLL